MNEKGICSVVEGLVNEKGKGLTGEIDCGSESESETEPILELGLDSDSDSESESDGVVEMKLIMQSKKVVKYDDDGNPHFLLGMTFKDAKEARVDIAKYSMAKSTPLKLNPNEKHRIRANCKSVGCPFVLFMSQSCKSPHLIVKKFNSEHNCLKDAKNSLATGRFLVSEFKSLKMRTQTSPLRS